MKRLLRKLNFFVFFFRAFKGEIPLSQAFYGIYIIGNVIAFIIIEYIFHTHLTGSYIHFDVHTPNVDKFILFMFPYLCFSSICVWACGKNSWIEWSILSKIIVIIPFAVASFHLIRIF